MTTTLELVQYYGDLLIIQYIGKEKAQATIQAQATPFVLPQTTIQTLAFSTEPTSGTFTLTYGEDTTAALNWDDTATEIQTALRALDGLAAVTVTGDFVDGFIVTFDGVEPVAEMLVVATNILQDASDDVEITVAEIDEILPLAVQNAFNLVDGTTLAVGAQLDIIGDYVGVTRTARGFQQQITLDDEDFHSLIEMATIKNSAGSSLATIQELLHTFFPDQLLVFDYQNMQMSYLLSTEIGSRDLVEMFIVQGLLPKPMGVGVALVILAPDITNFFGFRTYDTAAFNATPFNSYTDYQTDWPWLSYAYAIDV